MAITNVSNFWETLVMAANKVSATPKYTNALLDCVFTGLEPEMGKAVGQTITIITPTVDTSTVTDIGSGSISLTDLANGSVTLSLATKMSTSFAIKSFDQVRTSAQLEEFFIGPRLESLLRKVDADLWSGVASGFASPNGTVPGTGGKFTRAQLATAKSKLDAQGAPTDDTDNMFLICHSDVYNNTAADTTFSQQYFVGDAASQAALQRGILVPALGATLKKDQQAPLASSVYTNLLMHRYAYGVRYAIEPKLADDNFLKETIVFPKPGMPVKIQMWNDPVAQGITVHLSCVYGKAVTRSAFGVLLSA